MAPGVAAGSVRDTAAHAEHGEAVVPALWLAATMAVGCGAGDAHHTAKALARAADPAAAEALLESALQMAAATGLQSDLDRAADSIDFALPRPADRG